jgi:hypothetical protein
MQNFMQCRETYLIPLVLSMNERYFALEKSNENDNKLAT